MTDFKKEDLQGRNLEASVLVTGMQMLKNCQDNWDAPDRETKLREALNYNQSIWSIFQAELSKPDNSLPLEIRQNILNLSIFVDKKIIEALADPSKEKLNPIIRINANIAAGLLGIPVVEQETFDSGRELEASILVRCALMLKDCQDNWSAPDINERLERALRYNQTIWTVLQTEISKPENPLPLEMKNNLLNLSLFIDKKIFEALAEPSPEKLTPIMSINANIAAGLLGIPLDES
ncbi:MAG: flagellar biosynthesis regulator FlaF [Thermodesulfovibrionales bacterium]|nr:flagellar biosynthesis regulator FlaF [Thermodesulfovibrionales bacterium]